MPKQTPHVKRAIALTAALALTVSGITVHKGENAQAASKAPTLSASSVTLKKGQTKKIKINANKQKIKKVTWKVDKKKLKITKKTKKYAVVKALKTGSASISVTIVTNKKTYKKKVKVSVAAKKKATPKPVNTNKPSETTPSKTSDVPSVSNTPQESAPAVSEKPQETTPAVSEEPQETTPTITDKPQESAPAVTTKPGTSSKPVTPSKPVTSGITEVASTGSWNVGVLAKLPAYLRGRTVKFSLQMMETGIAVGKNASSVSAGKAIKVISNYNGYPTLANISTEPSVWKTVSFTYRFNDFTSTDPILYFDVTDSVSATEKANVKIYVQNFTYEIVDLPDPLGGDCLQLGSWDTGWDADGNWQDSRWVPTWHCGSPLSLRNDSLNSAAPHKAYENKKVRISLDVRVKGAPETPSGTFDLKAQVDSWENRVSIKEGIVPSADWQTIDEVVNFREIPQQWPSVIFVNDDHAIDSATMEVFVRNVNIEILGEADATPTPAPSVAPGAIENLVLTDDDLGASADFTYEANGAAQYETVAQLKLSGDKFTSNPTLSLEWEAKDKNDNDITATTKFNITIRKDNPNWQEGDANVVAVAYEKTSSHSMQLGADKVSSLTSDNNIFIVIATSTAGFDGTFTLKKAALNSTEETNLPAAYTYVENGMNKWAPTAQVSLPADIDFSKYKSCEIEYTVDDVGSTGVGLYVVVGAKDSSNQDKNIPNYDENRASGKFVITLTDTLKTLTGFTNPYIKIQTGTAGFKGSVTITKVTFVLND